VACRPIDGQWLQEKQIYNSRYWVTALQTNIPMTASKNVSMEAEDIDEIHHQGTTGEDTADWGDLVLL
jgi:hypothetical protein